MRYAERYWKKERETEIVIDKMTDGYIVNKREREAVGGKERERVRKSRESEEGREVERVIYGEIEEERVRMI